MMRINCPQLPGENAYRKFTFPAGEPHVILNDEYRWNYDYGVEVEFCFEKADDIVELILLCHTLREHNIPVRLILPYVPFGQADRVNEWGECFSLKVFAEVVNNIIRPTTVTLHDPHSYVAPALFNNCRVIPQWEIMFNCIINPHNLFDENTVLISPDAGASKKIYKLAKLLGGCPVVESSKIRDTKNGQILATKVYADDLSGLKCLIVDDCVVGGRTYIEIAKILKERGAAKIILATTNGIYSQGVSVFDEFIDEIYNRKGRVK